MIATRTLAVEPEDLAQVPAQLLDVVADAADAELAEVGQVLADLRGVEMELLGERLRRDVRTPAASSAFEAAQVDRQAVASVSSGDRLGDDAVSTAVRRRRSFVRPLSQATSDAAESEGDAGRERGAQAAADAATSAALARPSGNIAPLWPTHMPTPRVRDAGAFQPYVPASQSPAEFTLKAVVLGVALRPDLRRLDGLPRACAPA